MEFSVPIRGYMDTNSNCGSAGGIIINKALNPGLIGTGRFKLISL